jgi:hypothetical protein
VKVPLLFFTRSALIPGGAVKVLVPGNAAVNPDGPTNVTDEAPTRNPTSRPVDSTEFTAKVPVPVARLL